MRIMMNAVNQGNDRLGCFRLESGDDETKFVLLL